MLTFSFQGLRYERLSQYLDKLFDMASSFNSYCCFCLFVFFFIKIYCFRFNKKGKRKRRKKKQKCKKCLQINLFLILFIIIFPYYNGSVWICVYISYQLCMVIEADDNKCFLEVKLLFVFDRKWKLMHLQILIFGRDIEYWIIQLLAEQHRRTFLYLIATKCAIVHLGAKFWNKKLKMKYWTRFIWIF